MLAVQAGVVAAPRASPERARGSSASAGRGWALVPIGSIVGRDLRDPLRVRGPRRADLARAGRGADPGRGRARVGDARGQAARGARGDAAVRARLGTRDTLAGEARGGAAVGAQLRDARRAARGGDAAGLAEGRDRADGRRRCVARGLGPAPGARTARSSRRSPPAGLPQLQPSCSARSRWATATCSWPRCSGAVLARARRRSGRRRCSRSCSPAFRPAVLRRQRAAGDGAGGAGPDRRSRAVRSGAGGGSVASAGRRRSTPAAATPRPAR